MLKHAMRVLRVGVLWLGMVGRALGESEPITDVYVLAGQSNAEGHNHATTYTPAPFPDVWRRQTNVLFWPGSNAKAGLKNTWTVLQVGASGINPHAFGPEITFGHSLATAQPQARIAIIKYAVGGTGIARSKDYDDYIAHPQLINFNDHGRNWHWPEPSQPAGSLYTNLLVNVRDALQALKDQGTRHRLAGFLWMQGEHEAGISPKMAKDYPVLLAGLIKHLRADLGQPALPFVIGQVSDKWIFHPVVQAAQTSVCEQDPYAALVVTRDLPRTTGDDAHYTANGMVTLGERFAASMRTLTRP
ncbi:MAG: hypothetical protein JNN07_14410 [Verrucomicrobiales bacterium]|nr:hypothetical protein [Verrucomicrobiales bacterium]